MSCLGQNKASAYIVQGIVQDIMKRLCNRLNCFICATLVPNLFCALHHAGGAVFMTETRKGMCHGK